MSENGLSKRMSLKRRAAMVRAMDEIARCVNKEELVVGYWFSIGVADGDITKETKDEDLSYYCEDENFKELMGTFLMLMKMAESDGGLYCDRIVSEIK